MFSQLDQLQQWRKHWEDMPQPRKIRVLRVVVFVCYFLALLLLVIYWFGGTSRRVSEPASVVIFMECMPGSIAALRYLSKRADVSIAMIVLTANAWNLNLNAAYENTLGLLAAMREEGMLRYDIAVYYGNTVAQVNSHFIDEVAFPSNGQAAPNVTSCTYRRVLSPALLLEADSLFGASEMLDAACVSALTSNGADASPYEFFDAPLSQYLSSHTATFMVLGPSTDAAWFLQRRPEHRDHIKHIVIAGGAMSADGDTRHVYPPNHRSEMHMFFDPHAANYLTSGAHGLPVVLLPLDASPRWPESLYDTFITSRISSVSAPLSARVVARAISGHNIRLPTDFLPIEVLAASYFADVHTRSGATVAEVPLLVANGIAMATDGSLGTVNGISQQKNVFKVKVVLRVHELSFWMRFEAVDRL